MGEQLSNSSILDQFINSHEQSYEEFLNTFMYLSKGEEGKRIQGSQVDSFRKTCSPSELPERNKEDASPGRSQNMWVSFPAQPKEKEQVDKHGDVGDTHLCEETCTAGSFVLPGEVEQPVTYPAPFLEKPVQQKLRTMSAPQPSASKAQELLEDDVQPFSLDEEFDYDNVALTPKVSEAELKAILELSEEKKTRTDVKSA